MANEYADVVDLMERLNIPENDAREGQLQNIVEVASRWVDEQTGHRFYTVTETRYYNALDHILPSQAWAIETLERPWGSPARIEIDDVLTVSQVATDEDGDGTYERVWETPGDYWLGPRNAPARGQPYKYLNRSAATSRYLFPLWEESISVTGSFGWCALADRPTDIRELTLMVGEVLGTTLTDLAQPGIQTYNITQQLSVVMAPETLPPLGQQILQKYRGVSIL
jgi:hypothetical protein